MENKITEYVFTGFFPSGNPFDCYLDENRHTVFTNSIEVSTWTKKPKNGDKVKFEESLDKYGQWKREKIWINNELVYTYSEEKEKQQEDLCHSLYADIRKEKGLVVHDEFADVIFF